MRHRQRDMESDLLDWLCLRTPCPYCGALAGELCIERDCYDQPTGGTYSFGHKLRKDKAWAIWQKVVDIINTEQRCQACDEVIGRRRRPDGPHRCETGTARRPTGSSRGVSLARTVAPHVLEQSLPPEKEPPVAEPEHEHQWPKHRIGGPCETCGARPTPSGLAFALGAARIRLSDAELVDLLAAELVRR